MTPSSQKEHGQVRVISIPLEGTCLAGRITGEQLAKRSVTLTLMKISPESKTLFKVHTYLVLGANGSQDVRCPGGPPVTDSSSGVVE